MTLSKVRSRSRSCCTENFFLSVQAAGLHVHPFLLISAFCQCARVQFSTWLIKFTFAEILSCHNFFCKILKPVRPLIDQGSSSICQLTFSTLLLLVETLLQTCELFVVGAEEPSAVDPKIFQATELALTRTLFGPKNHTQLRKLPLLHVMMFTGMRVKYIWYLCDGAVCCWCSDFKRLTRKLSSAFPRLSTARSCVSASKKWLTC